MLRKGLVVFQFAISIALIAVTIIVYRQLNYMRNKDLGFNKEQEIIINTNFDKNTKMCLSNHYHLFRVCYQACTQRMCRVVITLLLIQKWKMQRVKRRKQISMFILLILIISISIN